MGLKTFIFLSAIGVPHLAHAIITCPKGKSQFSEIKHLAAYFKQVEGETNKVYSIDEYANAKNKSAETFKEEISASGRIQCGKLSLGSGQLIGSNDLVATSGHNFLDENCKPIDVSKCTYTPLFSKKTYRFKVSSAKIVNDLRDCKGETVNNTDDWALLELTEKVENATPYLIPPRPVQMRKDNQLIQVAAQADNYKNKRTPYVAECEVLSTGLRSREFPDMKFPVATNCAAQRGASGGAQLVERPTSDGGSTYEFLGLVRSTDLSAKDGDVASVAEGKVSGTTPFNGEFYDYVTSTVQRRQEQDKSSKRTEKN